MAATYHQFMSNIVTKLVAYESGGCRTYMYGTMARFQMKSLLGQAQDLSGIVTEMLNATGKVGLQWVNDVCNAVIQVDIPED